jgi:hypothetical protein
VVVRFVDIDGMVDHHMFILSFYKSMCQWLSTGLVVVYSVNPDIPTYKTDSHNTTEILLKMT